MMKIDLSIAKKIGGVFLLSVVLLASLSLPALATGVNIRALQPVGGPGGTIYNNTGSTPLPDNYLVQIFQAVGSIDAPNTADPHYAGGDDIWIADVHIGDGTGNVAGSLFSAQGTIGGKTIYIRAWEGTTFSSTTRYGNSTTQSVPDFGAPIDWNVASFSTTLLPPTPDVTAPAAIDSLAASTGTASGTVNLTWTAVGDDGTTGTASSYILKYSTSAITSVNFDAATTYSQSWTPAAAGATETKTLTGLTAGATLYFAIKARDEVPNTGNFGNCDDAVVGSGGPSLSSATPPDGDQGETLTSVAIVGSGTHFTSASSVEFGSGITHGTITVTDATNLSVANVVISSTATTGLRSVSVTTGSEIATGSIFTVNAVSTGDTTVVIDDYEGTAVDPTGYYVFGPSTAANPTATRVTGSANLHEGTYGMNTTYSAATVPADGWRGWGGVLSSTKNLSSTSNLVFWLKGDGTTNKVKVQFKDADGTNYALSDTDAVSTNSAIWHECTITDFKTKMSRVAGSTTGDSTMDWANITEYQLVFVGSSASTGVLVDYVVATGSTSTTPTIVSISPALGPAGTAVTLVGSNFGTAGDIRFARSGTGTYSIRSTDSNVTSYSSGQIVFTTPALSTGIWNVTVYVTPAESNSVSFEVTAGAPGATDPYNYPNPFNPYRSEITTIVFYPGTSTSATIYLFDSTAKVVQKISWTGTANAAGQASVTWDGKNAYNEIVGDGVYLYRVVDGSKALGKGKILAVNK